MKQIKLKTFVILFAGAFGAVILMSIAGGVLESSGYVPTKGAMIGMVVFSLSLVMIMAFSIVPIAVKGFFYLFEKVRPVSVYGPLPQWFYLLKEKHMVIVYAMWGFYLLGLLIALPAMIKGGFFSVEAFK